MSSQNANCLHHQQTPAQVSPDRLTAAGTASVRDMDSTNTEYVAYLKQMISSLLDNQMTLSAALDETREACTQLNLERAELEASSTQEVQILQAELSMCRQREAEVALAYEDLRCRVESIDQVIEQISWLDVLFNSDDPLPVRLKTITGDDDLVEGISTSELKKTVCYDDDDDEEEEDETTPHHLSPEHHHCHSWAERRKGLPRGPKRTGSDSPFSDSGCTSESHDELSLNSAQSSPYLSQALCRTEETAQVMGRSLSVMGPLDRTVNVRMRNPDKRTANRDQRVTSAFGRITKSLRASICRFADKSEWKMEALVAKQREARALVLLNETQAEVRRVESRCTGLTRRQNEQEVRMAVKAREIERLLDQERELRRELRNWQQRVFQLESETQEVKHHSHILELEMKSQLLEAKVSVSEATAARYSYPNAAAPFFNEDLLRLKPLDDTALQSESEESGRPPKFLKPSSRGRPRFSSTTSLSRLPSNSSSSTQQQSVVAAALISRPASSLHLNRSTASELPTQRHQNLLLLTSTTSFGSLSELELKADL